MHPIFYSFHLRYWNLNEINNTNTCTTSFLSTWSLEQLEQTFVQLGCSTCFFPLFPFYVVANGASLRLSPTSINRSHFRPVQFPPQSHFRFALLKPDIPSALRINTSGETKRFPLLGEGTKWRREKEEQSASPPLQLPENRFVECLMRLLAVAARLLGRVPALLRADVNVLFFSLSLSLSRTRRKMRSRIRFYLEI